MTDQVLNRKVDMVVGDRLSSTYFMENKRPFHNFGNSLVRKSINMLFETDIKDIMTGYRAFSFEFVKTFPVLSKGFEIETEMSIHAVDKNMFVDNVVITYRDRPEGSVSKLNTYADGFKVLRTIARLYRAYKPVGFFGSIAMVLALIAAGFFIPVMETYIETGLVPNFPDTDRVRIYNACSNSGTVYRTDLTDKYSEKQIRILRWSFRGYRQKRKNCCSSRKRFFIRWG